MGTPFDAGPIQTPTAPKSGGSPFDSAPARQLSPADQKAANDLFNKYANMPRLDATQPGGSQAAVERPASPSPGVEFPIPLPGGGSFNFHTSEGSTLPSGRGLVARIGNQARQQDAETAAAKEGTLTRYWGAMGSRLPNFPASVLRIGTLAARLMGNDDAADEMEGYIGPSTRAMQAQPRTAGEKAFAAGTGALMYAGVPLGAGAFAGQSAIDTANEAKAQGASNLTALGAGGVAGAGTYGALHLTGRVGNSIPGIKAARDAEGNLLPWDKILDNPKTWGEIAKGIAINGGETSGLMSLAKFADNLYAKATYAPHQDLRDGLLESAVVGFGFGMGHINDKIDMARVKDAVLSHPDGPIEVGKQATDALESGENLVRIAQAQVDSAPDAKAKADAQDLLAKANKQVDVFGKVSRTANYLLKTKEGMAAQARANARPKIDPNADILEPPEPGADTGATGLNVEFPKPVPTLGMRGENRTPGMTSDDRIVGTGDAKYGSAVTGISGDQNIGATPLPGPPAGPSWETQRMQQIEQRIADITKNPTSENAAEHIKLVEEYLKLAAQTGIKNRLNPAPAPANPTIGMNPPENPILPARAGGEPYPEKQSRPSKAEALGPRTELPGPPPVDPRQGRMNEIDERLRQIRANPTPDNIAEHAALAKEYADLAAQGIQPTQRPTLGLRPLEPAAYYPPGTGPRGPIPMPGPPPVAPGTPELGMQVPPKGATPMPGPPPPDARQTRMGEIEKQLETVRQNPGAMSGPDHIKLALEYADLIGQGVKPAMVAPPTGPPPPTEKPKAISISETQTKSPGKVQEGEYVYAQYGKAGTPYRLVKVVKVSESGLYVTVENQKTNKVVTLSKAKLGRDAAAPAPEVPPVPSPAQASEPAPSEAAPAVSEPITSAPVKGSAIQKLRYNAESATALADSPGYEANAETAAKLHRQAAMNLDQTSPDWRHHTDEAYRMEQKAAEFKKNGATKPVVPAWGQTEMIVTKPFPNEGDTVYMTTGTSLAPKLTPVRFVKYQNHNYAVVDIPGKGTTSVPFNKLRREVKPGTMPYEARVSEPETPAEPTAAPPVNQGVLPKPEPKPATMTQQELIPQESAGPSMTRRVGGENVSVPLSETGQTRLENAQKDFKAEMQEVDQMKPESTEGPDTTKQTRAELRAQAAEKLAEAKKQIQIQQEANEAGAKTNSEILSKEARMARAKKRKGETGALFLGRDENAEPPMTAAELWKFVKDALPNPEDLHLSNAIFAQMQRNEVVTKGVAQRYLHPADLLIEQANKTVQLPGKPTNKQMDFGTYQLESQRHADMVAGSEAGRILGDRYSDDTKTRARDYYDAINAGLKPDLSKIGPMELAAIRDLRPLMENQGKLFESQRIRKGADPEDAIANDALIPRRVEDNGKGELPPGNKQTVNGAMRVKGRSEMNRSMVAGTDADSGERLVMSLKSTPKKVFYMEDGVRRELETSNMQKSATVWKDGAPIGEAMRDPNAKPGEAADYIWKDEQGNKHTLKVGQATTNEIEAHTGMKYRSDPFGTTIDSIVDLNNVRRTLDVLDQLKQHGIAEKVPESGEVPDGYLKIDLKNLNGYMAPKGVADSLNALHERITAAAKLPNPAMQIARMISVNLGFLNPSVHMPNMFDHFMGGGGVTKWAQPGAYDRVAQAFDTAAYMARDGLTRNRILAMGATVNPMASKLAIDALNAGMPMMNATPETSAVLKSYIETIGATIKENPSKWGFLGDKPQEVMDRVQGAINAVGDKVWMVDNMARLTHVLDYADAHKLDIGNPDQLKQAVQEVGRSSYVDYRIPSEVFGSRAVSKALQSDLMLFMRYHYGAMSLLKNKVLDAVNPAALKDQSVPANQLARERMKKDYDKLAMLAIMNAAIYPLLSQGVKAVTGDEESEYRKGGTSKLATDIGRTVTGQQPPERLANGFFTLAPWIRAPLETAFTNKNLFTNRKVISQADLYKTFDPESSAEDRLAAMGRFAGNVGTEVMSNVGPLSQWQAATYNRPGEEKDTLDKARHFAGALLGGRQVNEGAIESLPKRMNQEYVKEERRLAKEQ